MKQISIREDKIKKTYRLNPTLIEEVQKILGAKTETETIEKALEQIRFKTELNKWIGKTSGRFPKL